MLPLGMNEIAAWIAKFIKATNVGKEIKENVLGAQKWFKIHHK
jgi:hypothetical protein